MTRMPYWEVPPMRFLVLLTGEDHFDNWDNASEELRERSIADYNAFADVVRQRGTLIVGDALDRPETARSLRPGPAPRSVTRGPFAETVEQIGGFYLVDLPDVDTAVEAAALLPRECTIEVRPALGITV
jgi:hypothetical protein